MNELYNSISFIQNRRDECDFEDGDYRNYDVVLTLLYDLLRELEIQE